MELQSLHIRSNNDSHTAVVQVSHHRHCRSVLPFCRTERPTPPLWASLHTRVKPNLHRSLSPIDTSYHIVFLGLRKAQTTLFPIHTPCRLSATYLPTKTDGSTPPGKLVPRPGLDVVVAGGLLQKTKRDARDSCRGQPDGTEVSPQVHGTNVLDTNSRHRGRSNCTGACLTRTIHRSIGWPNRFWQALTLQ